MKTFNIYLLVFLFTTIFHTNDINSQEYYSEEQIDESAYVILDGNSDGFNYYTTDTRYSMQMYPGQHVLGLHYNPYCMDSDFKYFGRYYTNCKNSLFYLASHLEYGITEIRSNAFGDVIYVRNPLYYEQQSQDSQIKYHIQGNEFGNGYGGGISEKPNSKEFYDYLYGEMKKRADEIVRKNQVDAYNKGYAMKNGRIHSVSSNSQNNYSSSKTSVNSNQTKNTYTPPKRNSSSSSTRIQSGGSFRPSEYNKTYRTSSKLTK